MNASRSAQLFRIVPQFWQINLHLISLMFVEPQTSQTSTFISPPDNKKGFVRAEARHSIEVES